MELTIRHRDGLPIEEPPSWRWWMRILTPEARRVLRFLWTHGGSTYDFDRAAHLLSLSHSRVLRALKELERYGFVVIND